MVNKMSVFLVGFLFSATLAFAEQKIAPSDIKVILERTECFGTCPVYKLTIYADGKIEFFGEKFVNAIGQHVKTISQEKIASILAEANAIKFFELNGDYDCYLVTDNPTAKITITEEGKTNCSLSWMSVSRWKRTGRVD